MWKGDRMALTVGVDVGGTKIAAGVVTTTAGSSRRCGTPRPPTTPTRCARRIASVVEELRTRHEVAAVGVSAAGFVSADRRSMLFAPNLSGATTRSRTSSRTRSGSPVVVENDANAAAWAEYRFGAGGGVPDQLMVTLGTGVGGGLILGGEIYRGAHGVAARDRAHRRLRGRHPVRVRPARLPGAVRLRAARWSGRPARPPSGPRAGAARARPGATREQVTGAMVTELAQQGDEDALALFERARRAPRPRGSPSLVAVLDPALVVLGGGVSEAGDVLLEPTAAALEPRAHRR